MTVPELLNSAIKKPVGRNGTNLTEDILLVQSVLVIIPEEKGGWKPAFEQLGQDTPALRSAIERFQTIQKLMYRDGRVDPGGSTWRRMVDVAIFTLSGGRSFIRLPGTPAWRDWGWRDLPLLADADAVTRNWDLTFGGKPEKSITTCAFLCPASARVRHLGVAYPSGTAGPGAYLIYFHHSIKATDYPKAADNLEAGIGDYLIGRMQIVRQLSLAKVNVAVVVPEPQSGGVGEFDHDEAFITKALQEIDLELTGSQRDLPPLMLASYSDGIGHVQTFTASCPRLKTKLKAIYDFDGSLVVRFHGFSMSGLASAGVKVFRYNGNTSPPLGKSERPDSYLQRQANQAPAQIALPIDRWKRHSQFSTSSSAWGRQWWLHWFIPSCMLHHGLVSTPGL